jgi:hypothetical protein
MKTFLKENFFKFMIGLSALIVSIAILMYIISITKSNTSSEDNIISSDDNVIGEPIRIGDIEVAQYDFPKLNWDDAVHACANLGSGWRLPTKDELYLMSNNKDYIGGFSSNYYWSSTVFDDGVVKGAGMWLVDVGIAHASGGCTLYKFNVRAVRSF